MTVCQNQDLLSKIQSSYLWNTYEQQSNSAIKDIPTEDSNLSNEFQQVVSPHFETIIERSQVTSPENVPIKQPTATSLSEMCFKSSEETKPRTVWTPTALPEDNSQMPMIAEQQFSRIALLPKRGRPICQIRMTTIAFICLILALCGIAVGVPLGFILRPSTTATTSTTTTTTSSTTSTSTTSTTTTTTTPPATEWIPANYYTNCSITCITVSTVTPSTLLASWTFEENTNDVSGNGHNGQIVNGASFTDGYIGQAIVLRSSSTQSVSVSYINLVNQSFTVEAWIYLYSLVPTIDLSIIGECEAGIIGHCLHYLIRSNKLYLSFYGDDLTGSTVLTTSVWYHVAFVYDYPSNIKSIYVNGLIDGISTASGSPASLGAFLGASGDVTIGGIGSPPLRSWDGLLDQLTLTNRAKTPCEILNDASLVAYFPFDNNYNDIGPNLLTGTYNPLGNSGLSWVSGRVNQALNFNSSNSFFQSCGSYALGINQPYSIAMWVNPSFPSGTLFHLSSSATGSSTWCIPMIGFSSNGSIVAQTWRGFSVAIMGPVLPINTWTHLVQTYSSTNGLRLYINGGLYASATVNTFVNSGLSMCILLGSSGLGGNCDPGLISMGAYSGAIDELYVYNRELKRGSMRPPPKPVAEKF